MTGFKAEPRHWLLIIALLLALYASYLLIAPYVGAIVLAFVLSLLCISLHKRLEAKLPGKPNLAAALSCTTLVLVIVIPAGLVFFAIVQQAAQFTKQSYQWLSKGGAEKLLQNPYIINTKQKIEPYLPDSINTQDLVQRLTEFASSFGKVLLDMGTKLVGDITGVLFGLFLMLFILFFLLRDHDKVVDALHWLVPLSRSQENALLVEAKSVARSAVMGSFLTGIAQGVAGGIAMSIVGLPGLFWGTMMAFASFIPLVGTALIWIPAALYLGLTGEWGWAAFLVGWGIIVVGSIDNFLRPILMQGSSNMNTLMIFLSLIGGIQLFGLIGVIYGPIIFALTVVLLKLYAIEFKGFLEQQDKS
ncbi:AI-2E family transporter [Rheinheimera sp. WS51]|uniref:AI-2E family transporter n=1 Tax=Rheinheimera sp. WS51 TaxID=3425886 RepID=UPI003D8AAD95